MDIKGALYGLLGKKKLGQPVYTVLPADHSSQHRFACDLHVPGIDYVGHGLAQSKKDAQASAARDFAHYLVQKGLIKAADLPSLNGVAMVGGGQEGYQMRPDLQAQAVGGSGIMDLGQGRPIMEPIYIQRVQVYRWSGNIDEWIRSSTISDSVHLHCTSPTSSKTSPHRAKTS